MALGATWYKQKLIERQTKELGFCKSIERKKLAVAKKLEII
jgi:hypothetical protein